MYIKSKGNKYSKLITSYLYYYILLFLCSGGNLLQCISSQLCTMWYHLMGGNIDTLDIGNPINHGLQTTHYPQLLHFPTYPWLCISFSALLMSDFPIWSLLSSRLEGNLRRVSEVCLLSLHSSHLSGTVFWGPCLLWSPQTPHFFILTQGDCCALSGLTLPALQPGNSRQLI